MICSIASSSAFASEIGSFPKADDGLFALSAGYYLMRSEWDGFDDADTNNIINDIERDAPFVKLGVEVMDDWYASVLFGYEKITNNPPVTTVLKLDTDSEFFVGVELKGVMYRDEAISMGPFIQANAFTNLSISGPILSNGTIKNIDAEVTDILTAKAGFMAQYQFDKLAVYGGAYYMHSEAKIDGNIGLDQLDLTIEDDNNARLLLGVNIPLSEKLSLDVETHYYDEASFAIALNYYPTKTKPVKKATPAEPVVTKAIKPSPPEATEFENQIYFEQGATEVGESEYKKIRALARFMLKRPDSDVIIEGHCDCFGEEEFNQELSEKRALSVKKLLMNFYNIPEDRILLVGYGESFPLATNTTKEGRQKNRRVRVYATD